MDTDRFLALIYENKRLIYKVCRNYCGNAEDREDLAQEIIIQLWRSASRYDDRQQLTPWVYRVALNVAISAHRRQSRRVETTTQMEDALVSFVDEPQGEDERTEPVEQLYRYIGEMDELNRALMLLYLDRRSHVEISGILGISPTNVTTKISRLKRDLKNRFETETEEV